jgi:hypothetical protein
MRRRTTTQLILLTWEAYRIAERDGAFYAAPYRAAGVEYGVK